MREADVVAAIRDAFARAGALGDPLDDDAATLPAQAHGAVRIVTTDAAVQGVDFDDALYPLRFAGVRAIAQNVSDVVAMGARPVAFVWALATPKEWAVDGRLQAFVEGAAAEARRARMPLLGGDLSSTTGPFVASVTAFGDVRGTAVRRGGARPGDGVYVARPLGASAAGLRALLAARAGGRFDAWLARQDGLARAAIAAHLDPRPPVEAGPLLAGRATSCIDVSDGLAIDLARVCAASGVGAVLDALDDGVHPAASRDDALSGGEDFVPLFTTSDEKLLDAIEAVCGERPVRVGRIVAGAGVVLDGRPLAPAGWDHFGA